MSTELFHHALEQIVEHPRVHLLLQGRATRVLTDAGALDVQRAELRLSRALSIGSVPLDGAHFVEGFLAGAGTVLVHDQELLGVFDRWLATLPADTFVQVLPLLRRTFADFESAQRRQIGEQVRSGAAVASSDSTTVLDPERVAAALQTVAALLARPG